MASLADNAGILFKIKADSADAIKDLALTQAGLKGLAQEAEKAGVSLKTFGAVSAIGIAAITTAAAAATAALFSLAKSSAEYGSAIFDATEKTGLGAETISSLKIAADQSGTSLETVTSGLAKFAKTIGEASDGSDKAQAKLAKVGVTSHDLDTALSQALVTIAKYPPGVAQMTAAQAAFGKSGADLLPFIKSFDGNLPALIAKCKALGLTLTNEDARAADAFGDTLDTLSAQASATGRTFIGPLMRDITQSMTDISGALAKNQVAVKEWGESVASTMRGLKTVAAELYDFAQTPSGRALRYLLFGAAIQVNAELQKLGGPPAPLGAPYQPSSPNEFQIMDQFGRPIPKAGKTGFGPSDEERQAEADKRAKEREAEFQKELASRTKQNSLLLSGERAAFSAAQRTLEEYYIGRQEIVDQNGQKFILTDEKYREVMLANIATYGKKVQALLDQQRALGLKGAKSPTDKANVETEFQQASSALYQELIRERADLEKTITGVVKKETSERTQAAEKESRDTIAIAQATAKAQIAAIEDSFLSESKKAEQIGELKLGLLRRERELETDETRRLVLDQEIAEQIIKNSQAITEAWKAEGKAYLELIELQKKRKDEQPDGLTDPGVGGLLNGTGLNLPDGSDAAQALQFAKDFALGIGPDSAVMQAVNGLANGIGHLVENFILLGNAGGQSMRKIVASVLASVAAQAAVQAIMFTAYGIAALTPWGAAIYGPAAPWFKAAALMASVAVVAGAAGRGAAGSAFQQQTAGGGAGAGASGGTPQTSFTTSNANPFAGNNPLTQSINRQNEVIEQLARKIQGMSPGDVVTMGAADGSQAIRNAYHKELSDDGAGTTTSLARLSGQYR